MATIHGTNDHDIIDATHTPAGEPLPTEAADEIVGHGGNDTINGEGGDDALHGSAGNDTLFGSASNDLMQGNAGTNLLDGGAGNDTLAGREGIDDMAGGEGDDTYFVEQPGDLVHEAAGGGSDRVLARVDFTLPTGEEIERLYAAGAAGLSLAGNELANAVRGGAGNDALYGGGGSDNLQGQAGTNLLYGGTGNDTLGGRGGTDTMSGGAGDDSYVVDHAEDQVREIAGEGIDRVYTSLDWTLGAGQEVEELFGSAADGLALTGNELANHLFGSRAGDTLDGAAGADSLQGGGGDDTYLVDDAGDTVIEAPTGGIDQVRSTVDHTLADGVEILVLTGVLPLAGTGNAQGNTILGNAGDNHLDGGAGADRMTGGAGNDTFVVDDAGDREIEAAGGGIDTVWSAVDHTLEAEVEHLTLIGTESIDGTGNAFDNVLVGNAGDNQLDGRAGADTMSGGAGSDGYTVDTTLDVVREAAGGGFDGIRVEFDYTLPADEEIEGLNAFFAPAGVELAGNELNNDIVGSASNDRLYGGAGDDGLQGHDGVDTLYGGAGDDQLGSFFGTATMYGGTGNDSYRIEVDTDAVHESAGEGTDVINVLVAGYTLPVGVSVEVLDAVTPIDHVLVGNEFANTIVGWLGRDTLFGAGGDDSIDGSFDEDTLYGDAGDDSLYGYAEADFLYGGDGNDTLVGYDSADRLEGNAGNDVFRVESPFDSPLAARDTVADFVQGEDHFDFTAIADMTFIGGAAFSGTAPELRQYTDGANVVLAGDHNGNGATDFEVVVVGTHVFDAADFL
jgi:Ca2+-binding RTX toxin-like protein